MVLYSALLQVKPGEAIQWHLDAPIWIAIQCFIAQWITLRCYRYIQPNRSANTRAYMQVFLLSSLSFNTLITWLILIVESLIGIQTVNLAHVLSLLSMQFILHIIVGGFTLAYKAFEQMKDQQLTLQKAEKSLLESQVKVLQQHIDPHFLFNNLNVLSALIQQDPDDADEYLTTFSEIYRYILLHRDSQLVTLAEEIAFVRNYMTLINTRFKNAYQLKIDTLSEANMNSKVLPCALQLAIENAIKHNQGDKTNPLLIKITINSDNIRIFNEVREKPYKQTSTQLGIKNLQTRCLSILKRQLTVSHTDKHFELVLPLSMPQEAA